MNKSDRNTDFRSAMNAPRFVRGTKSRLFLYLGALSFVGVVVYVYHGAQIQLEDVRQASEKCQQQQESLSAQLQVIFEYKLRLEKSLQQEKNEHRQTKEELQNKADEEKSLKDKEILESMNKYTSLQQQHKLLKSQHEDLDEECNKVRILQLQGLEEKSTLEGQVQAVQQELVQIQAAREKELENLKERYKSCLRQDDKGNNVAPDPVNVILEKPKSLDKPAISLATKSRSTSPSGVQSKADQSNLIVESEKENADKASLKSTTPQINPDAIIGSLDRAPSNAANNVVPMPPPAKDQETIANAMAPPIVMPREQHRNEEVRNANRRGAFGWRKQQENVIQVPAGVVPARNDYENNQFKSFRLPNNNENPANEIDRGQNALPNPWGWNYRQPQQHPGFVQQDHMLHPGQAVPNHVVPNQHDNLLRFQYLNNRNNERLDSNDVHHQRGRLMVEPYREEDNQLENKEIPRNPKNAYAYNGDYEKDGQKNDLQLEEVEEEGDDDVDQIDYVNEGAKQNVRNNAIEHKRPMAIIEKPNNRDGVMVNPK